MKTRISPALLSALLMASAVLGGCYQQSQPPGVSPPTPSPIPLQPTGSPADLALWNRLKQGVVDGRAVAQRIVDLIPHNRVWQPPLGGGQPVRSLTDDDKAKILKIASDFEPVIKAKLDPDVSGVDTRDYVWKSFSHEDAVTVSHVFMPKTGISQKLMDYMGDQCYPGVLLVFHTRYDEYAYARMDIMVDLAQGRVVYVDGSIKEALLPPSPLANVNLESFTLGYGDNVLEPLNPRYSPGSMFGAAGTRFGPPWDRAPNLQLPAPSPTK